MADDQTEWMPASEAVTQLVRVHGNSKAVKAWLADALRDGSLAAKVSATWVSESPQLSFKPPDQEANVERDVIIPASRWQRSKAWTADQEQWRWPYDRFFVTLRRNPRRRRMFDGVQFSKSHVEGLACLPMPAGSEPKASYRNGVGGRKTAAKRWGTVAAALVGMQMRGELTPGFDLTANGLAKKLQSLTDEAFADTAMDGFSSSFLDAFRKL